MTSSQERKRASQAKYRAANRERTRASSAAWYLANRDRHIATTAAWKAANPERWRAYKAAWKVDNRERVRATDAAWELANSERRRATHVAWYLANAERQRATNAAWRAANLERWRANNAVWKQANPVAQAVSNHRRRARKRGNGGSYTAAEWQDKLTLYAGCCIYCGESKRLTIDHKVPLVRGGSNGIENIVPACQPCNSKKGTRTATEYIAARLRDRVA